MRKNSRAATPKQTGGGGFEYESKVAAYFLARLLADIFPFSNKGKITRIDFQTGNDGWYFDDVLLSLQDGESFSKVGVSVKSNNQITKNGIPKNVCRLLWQQFLGPETLVFNKDNDLILLVVTTLPRPLSKDLMELIKWASTGKSDALQKRLQLGKISANKKKLFQSFLCPADLRKKYSVKQSETWRLISRVLIKEFDFESVISDDQSAIEEICRGCLLNPTAEDARRLFNAIKDIRNQLAPISGGLDYVQLVDRLRYDFDLKGFADHIGDWKKINNYSQSRINVISNNLGGKLNLDRKERQEDLKQLLKEHSTLFLIGRSGSGKSSLISSFASEKIADNKAILWLDSNSLERNLSIELSLQYSFKELIDKNQKSEGFIIVDGIDRLFKEAYFANLNAIVNDVRNTFWRIIITCQTDDFEAVLRRFNRNQIQFDDVISYELDVLEEGEVNQINETFPELLLLSHQDHLKPIFDNLKYLDLLAYNASKIPALIVSNNHLTETDIIDWIWGLELSGDNFYQWSRFLQIMAENQAQRLIIGVSTSAFTIAESGPINGLVSSHLIIEENDRLFFKHDLFGDWALYKLIRSNHDDLKAFLQEKEISSPLWAKGIRLYGVFLATKDLSGNSWLQGFNTFNDQTPDHIIIQDLFLESIIYISKPNLLLDSIWKSLKDNEGKLLHRFLEIFLNKASSPNEHILNMVGEIPGLDSIHASIIERNLRYSFWISILEFIGSHEDEVLKLDRLTVARLTNEWLTKAPLRFIGRDVCARIAIKNGQWILDLKSENIFVHEDVSMAIYYPLMAAVLEMPEEASKILLVLCGRVQLNRTIEKKESDLSPKSILESYKIRDAIVWDDGPIERVDSGFAKVGLNDRAMSFVILKSPKLASEIVLALLIDTPRSIKFGYDSSHYKLDLRDISGWYPPLYSRGPFLQFLRLRPTEGLSTILKFINFATDRWIDSQGSKSSYVEITLDNKPKKYWGDQSVYFWFRDGSSVPDSVTTALMALEKYLMECVEKDVDITTLIDEVLAGGNSIAYLGLLVSVGKYRPELFLKNLFSIFSIFQFYLWERSIGFRILDQLNGSSFEDPSIAKMLSEWNGYSHRKKTIEQVAISLAFENQNLAKKFEIIVETWRNDPNLPEKNEPYTHYLFRAFDIKNYSPELDGDRLFLRYNEPKEITEKFTEIRKDIHEQSEIDLFAFVIHSDVEKKKVFDKHELDKIWLKINTFYSSFNEATNGPFDRRIDAVFAGIMVLILNSELLKSEWKEMQRWMYDVTNKTVKHWVSIPEKVSVFTYSYHWTQSCAKFLPILYTSNVNNTNLRLTLAEFCLKAPYDIVSIFFNSSASLMKWSTPEFVQLQNLMIMRARLIPSEINAVQNLIKSFKDSTISDIPLDWTISESAKSLSKNRQRPGFRQRLQEDEIDYLIILKTFASIPLEIDKSDKPEYHFAQAFWSRSVKYLKILIGEPPIGPKKDYYLSSFDEWLIKRICYYIISIDKTEKPKGYWQPLLFYGVSAEKYVETFMKYFFLYNLPREQQYDRVISEWRDMLTYASGSEFWKRTAINRFQYDNVWTCLIGLSYTQLKNWDNDYSSFTTKTINQFTNWTTKMVFNQKAVEKVILFLSTKSGVPFIKNGILLINFHIVELQKRANQPVPDGLVFMGFQHSVPLAHTLSHIWENSRVLIRSDDKLFGAFRSLVKFLVSIRSPIGIEIQSRMLEQ